MQELIRQNGREIKRLHDRIHATFNEHPHSPAHEKACAEFHARFDELAFPGGYGAGLRKIEAGDPAAIETALVFLEARPYFFRSQYIATKLLRLIKRANLSKSQQVRLENVRSRKKEPATPK